MEEATQTPKSKILKQLTVAEHEALAAYAVKHYFSENQVDKPWYHPGVNQENVLDEFSKSTGPISLGSLVELWKQKNSIQASIFRKIDQPQVVESYLRRENKKNERDRTPNSEWEVTLNSMRVEFGNITRAMIAKITKKGLQKALYLLDGIDPNDMSDLDEILLNERIEKARIQAAEWYSHHLWEYAGKISRFFKFLKQNRVLTKTEIDLISEDEFQTLSMLAYLKPKEISGFLLDDIEENENLIKTFQNAVSRFAFLGAKLPSLDDEDDEEE